MPEQILLQGKILGIEEFLLSRPGRSSGEELLTTRSQWITLITEVLPRALLAELGLSRMLLGSSGGGQFLLVLPGEARTSAEEHLSAAARHIGELSQGVLRLLWGVTENLGDWSVVRKRLMEGIQRGRGTPLAQTPDHALQAVFQPYEPAASPQPTYFLGESGVKLREASSVGWSPESPGAVWLNGGKHRWNLTPNLSAEGITVARHAAPADDGKLSATVQMLARRSYGRPIWGVLRGDADNFGVRLRRLQTIEEHVQLSVLYKQFFAGELEVVCSMPEFWRKVTILYSGGDDFAVYGSWDALILLAREMQRLFHRFTEENLKEFPGPEGKTITMALALAPEMHSPMAAVYDDAGRNLEFAKASDKDCIHLLGRILEWKQLSDAAEMKDTVTRLLSDSRASRQFLGDLRRFYQRESYSAGPRGAESTVQSAWRFQRRFNRILSGTKDREFQKLRSHLIYEMMGRKSPEVKLRPAGLVALEWARLASD